MKHLFELAKEWSEADLLNRDLDRLQDDYQVGHDFTTERSISIEIIPGPIDPDPWAIWEYENECEDESFKEWKEKKK